MATISHTESLAFFAQRQIVSGIKRTFTEQIYPTSSFGPLLSGLFFKIGKDENYFIDLKASTLYLELEVNALGADGRPQPLDANNHVSLINYPSGSLFRRVDMSIQGYNITRSTGDHYHLKAMVDSLLFSSKTDVKMLELGGYTTDKPGTVNLIHT